MCGGGRSSENPPAGHSSESRWPVGLLLERRQHALGHFHLLRRRLVDRGGILLAILLAQVNHDVTRGSVLRAEVVPIVI